MPAPDFLDTNVLVYANDASHAGKQRAAQNLVRKALGGEIVTSVQVLAEFDATLLHRISPAVDAEDVTAILDALNPIRNDCDLARIGPARGRGAGGIRPALLRRDDRGGRRARRLPQDLVGGPESRPEVLRYHSRESIPKIHPMNRRQASNESSTATDLVLRRAKKEGVPAGTPIGNGVQVRS